MLVTRSAMSWLPSQQKASMVPVGLLLSDFHEATDEDTQFRSLQKLGQFHDRLSNYDLETLAQASLSARDHRIRGEMCYLLGMAKRPRFTSLLHPILDDPEPWVRNQAKRALELLEKERPAKAVEYWMERLRSEDTDNRLRAAMQLGRLGVRTRIESGERGSFHTVAPRPLAMGGEAMRPAIQAMLDECPEIRREVAFALGEWLGKGDDLGIGMLILTVQSDPDNLTRIAAIEALGKIGGPLAVQTLTNSMLQDPDENARAQALSSLGDLLAGTVPDDEAASALIEILRQIKDGRDRSWYVHQLAIGTVEAIDSPE